MPAVIVGCMAPDFEYFLRLGAAGGIGHRMPGVLLFDLPVSLAALWFFYTYAQQPVYSWLPEGVRRRVSYDAVFPARNVAQFALVCLSIMIGVATHIFWDSFTHREFYPYQHWEILHRTVQLPVYGPLEYLRVLQHGSSIVGALVLVLWFRNWYRRTPPRTQKLNETRENRIALLIAFCLVAAGGAVVRALLDIGIPRGVGDAKEFFIQSVITCISFFWVEVLVYGAILKQRRNQLVGV